MLQQEVKNDCEGVLQERTRMFILLAPLVPFLFQLMGIWTLFDNNCLNGKYAALYWVITGQTRHGETKVWSTENEIPLD